MVRKNLEEGLNFKESAGFIADLHSPVLPTQSQTNDESLGSFNFPSHNNMVKMKDEKGLGLCEEFVQTQCNKITSLYLSAKDRVLSHV